MYRKGESECGVWKGAIIEGGRESQREKKTEKIENNDFILW